MQLDPSCQEHSSSWIHRSPEPQSRTWGLQTNLLLSLPSAEHLPTQPRPKHAAASQGPNPAARALRFKRRGCVHCRAPVRAALAGAVAEKPQSESCRDLLVIKQSLQRSCGCCCAGPLIKQRCRRRMVDKLVCRHVFGMLLVCLLGGPGGHHGQPSGPQIWRCLSRPTSLASA